jgi:hypothetical protein
MADTFSYNSVVISTPLVDVVEAEAVYDEADASVIYTRYRLRVTGTIQGTSAADFQQKFLTASAALMVPRGLLQVNFGGSDWFNGATDDKTGPLPRKCNFTEIIGATFCLVTFEVETWLQEKCDTLRGDGIISHTFTVSHTVDERCYTTRTIRGKYRMKPLKASGAQSNPDAIRGTLMPLIPKDFRRERMDFMESADGLEMAYEVVDKELYRAPPSVAVKASGKFRHQSTMGGWYNHITLEFAGNKSQLKSAMLAEMVQIVATRIQSPPEVIIQSTLEEDLYENVVRLDITTQYSADPGGAFPLFPANTQIFVINAATENHVIDNLGPYGSAQIAAAKATFFNPCDEFPIRYTKLQFSGSGDGSIAGGIAAAGGAPTATDTSNVQSQAQKDAVYIHWENYITYEQENGCETLTSTKAGTPGKSYQWHVPYQIVKQRGCAIRAGSPVVVPPPQTITIAGANVAGKLKNKRIIVGAPQLQPDKKTYEYSASWEYTIEVPLATTNLATSGNFVDVNTGTLKQPANLLTTFNPDTADTQLAKVDTPISL